MGLVFAAIILLWGVMVLLVKITTVIEPTGTSEAEEDTRELKMRAASAAVAAALALEEADKESSQAYEFPLPQTAIVSPWQSVMRANMLNKKGHVR